MLGLVLFSLSFSQPVQPIALASDVDQIETRRFAMPLQVDPNRRDKIERIRLFLSEDSGKTWKHCKDYKPSDEQVTFTAPRDGLYWFALQIVFKHGKSEPAEVDDLAPAMKVYVNTERRALKVPKSYEELQREVEDLRRTVEQLQDRIRDLESGRKPK